MLKCSFVSPIFHLNTEGLSLSVLGPQTQCSQVFQYRTPSSPLLCSSLPTTNLEIYQRKCRTRIIIYNNHQPYYYYYYCYCCCSWFILRGKLRRYIILLRIILFQTSLLVYYLLNDFKIWSSISKSCKSIKS